MLTTIGVGGALTWLLVGAPWTSLEWTRGLSLRYALPIAALLPVLGFIALFPVSWRWYDHNMAASIALSAVVASSLFTFYSALNPRTSRFVDVPSVSIIGLAVASVVLLTGRWASTQPRLSRSVTLLTCVVLAASWAQMIASRAERERQAATAREAEDRSAYLRGTHPQSAARDAYFLALASEDASGRSCRRRRFFALSRVDEPLMLQSAIYTNKIFYAARDIQMASRADPLGPCDYVITTEAVMETDKGTALVAALARGTPTEKVGTAGQFVILRRQ